MLKINNLHVSVDEGQKPILTGLSLDVPKGKVHAIMGPNGAGKSTLSYVLTGRDGYKVTDGTVALNGEDLLEMEPEERAAAGVFLSFQYPLEIPGVPTMTFLKTALNAQRKARGEEEMKAPEFLKKARALAAELKIKPEMLKRPLNVGFSGGEKKRMEIFQMMMLEPNFIVMDETDSGLDVDALRIVAAVSYTHLRAHETKAKLARNFGGKVWQVTGPAGLEPSEPLIIEGLNRGHIRIRIDIAKGASLSVIEHHAGDAGGFVNIDMTVTLKAEAKFDRTIVHNDPNDCVRIATAHITAWNDAAVTQHALSFGGALSRIETRMAGMGKNIEATLNGAYLLDDKRHCDMTSYIDLAVPDCTIRQAVKGVVTDKARGVFQGKFHVRRPAQHTDAEMRHDALMLSDTSEIRSKPELEIYADDVACAHGNTIGQLDESALFYMRQRGIPLGEARALLTEAFVADVFDDLEDEELRESLLGKLRRWLAR